MVYSVGIYKDKKENLLLIPYGHHRQGFGIALDNYKKLEQPYNAEMLGKLVRECLQISKDSPIIENVKTSGKVFEKATGIKGWSRFSKEHKYVSASWDQEKGYFFLPKKREAGGAYSSGKDDPQVELELDSSDKEIGDAVFKAFTYLE